MLATTSTAGNTSSFAPPCAETDVLPCDRPATPLRPPSSVDLERLGETLDDSLTVAEVARIARVAPNTVRTWQDTGCPDNNGVLHRLQFFRVGARRRYVHRRDLAAFLGAINGLTS